MRAQGFQRDSERVPTLAKCRGIRAALLKDPIFGWGFLLDKQRVAYLRLCLPYADAQYSRPLPPRAENTLASCAWVSMYNHPFWKV